MKWLVLNASNQLQNQSSPSTSPQPASTRQTMTVCKVSAYQGSACMLSFLLITYSGIIFSLTGTREDAENSLHELHYSLAFSLHCIIVLHEPLNPLVTMVTNDLWLCKLLPLLLIFSMWWNVVVTRRPHPIPPFPSVVCMVA